MPVRLVKSPMPEPPKRDGICLLPVLAAARRHPRRGRSCPARRKSSITGSGPSARCRQSNAVPRRANVKINLLVGPIRKARLYPWGLMKRPPGSIPLLQPLAAHLQARPLRRSRCGVVRVGATGVSASEHAKHHPPVLAVRYSCQRENISSTFRFCLDLDRLFLHGRLWNPAKGNRL